VFDVAERAVGSRLEAAVQDDRFVDVLAVTAQVSVEMRRRLERATRRMLHAANLPAASDIKRLSEQIGGVDRRLRSLEQRIEVLEPPSRAPAPTRLEARRRADGRQRQPR
jgi:hypothetical protein